jgi:hypothetical protein
MASPTARLCHVQNPPGFGVVALVRKARGMALSMFSTTTPPVAMLENVVTGVTTAFIEEP